MRLKKRWPLARRLEQHKHIADVAKSTSKMIIPLNAHSVARVRCAGDEDGGGRRGWDAEGASKEAPDSARDVLAKAGNLTIGDGCFGEGAEGGAEGCGGGSVKGEVGNGRAGGGSAGGG